MTGINRAFLSGHLLENRRSYVCVFLSHQKQDSSETKKIADYLLSTGIDVYFDEYDKDLKIAVQQSNPKGVVDAIKKGINNSTHMLCVISPNTLTSKWVPFEVGYGCEKTKLSAITLKGIKDYELPDYIKVVPILRDIRGLNNYVESFSTNVILERRNLIDYTSYSHPLTTVMDKIIY